MNPPEHRSASSTGPCLYFAIRLKGRDIAVGDAMRSPSRNAIDVNAEPLSQLSIGPAVAADDGIEQLKVPDFGGIATTLIRYEFWAIPSCGDLKAHPQGVHVPCQHTGPIAPAADDDPFSLGDPPEAAGGDAQSGRSRRYRKPVARPVRRKAASHPVGAASGELLRLERRAGAEVVLPDRDDRHAADPARRL
jgi:hypothetical protein